MSGNSAVLLGGNEGAGSYAFGVALDVRSKYRFDLKYVDFIGDTTVNPADHDHLQRRRQFAAHGPRLRGLHLQDHAVSALQTFAKEHTMKFAKTLLAGALLAALGTAQAKVGPDEAKLLGTKLTRVGAEMAGNADGTIPAYTGGLTTPPPASRPAARSAPIPSRRRSRA